MNKEIVVIGIGNIFRKDDAIGVKTLEFLEKKGVPKNVKLICGDISGLDIIKYFDHKLVIIIDAVKMGKKAGTITVFNPKETKFKTFDEGVSTHGISLQETLKIALELNKNCNIVIVGIEPYNVNFGINLADRLKKKIPFICNKIVEIIKDFKH